jgi:TonB family protein
MHACVAFKGGFNMSALVQKGIAQGRPLALAITIGVHVALVAGLLAIKVAETVQHYVMPLQMRDLTKPPDPVQAVKPIEPVLGNPVSMPTIVPELPDFAADERIDARTSDQVDEVIPIEPPRGIDTGTALPDTPLRYQAVRPTDDYYPPQAIRMAIEGAVVVRACVGADGRLSGPPSVVKSSHASLLDAAALKWAGEALRFQPATQAGTAIAACKEFRVSFTLH